MRTMLLVLALLLTGCAAALVTSVVVPTLEVTNGTPDQLNVSVEGWGGTIARVRAMSTACVKLASLPPAGDVVLVFRAVGSPHGIRAQPSNYSAAPGWALTITGTSSDGGFFAAQAGRCR